MQHLPFAEAFQAYLIFMAFHLKKKTGKPRWSLPVSGKPLPLNQRQHILMKGERIEARATPGMLVVHMRICICILNAAVLVHKRLLPLCFMVFNGLIGKSIFICLVARLISHSHTRWDRYALDLQE